MCEGIWRTAFDFVLPLESIEIRVEGQLAKAHDNLDRRKQHQFAVEMRTALTELSGCWFVIGRCAADGGCDPAVIQHKAIFPAHAFRL